MKDVFTFLKNYIKAQILLSGVLAILYCAGFGLTGLPGGYVIGFFTGALSWVPIFGSLLGFMVAMIVIAFSSDALNLVVKVSIFYLAAQFLEAFVLAPKIIGKTLGLGFLASLAAVIIGFAVLGPIGPMIAVPTVALLKFLLEKRSIEDKALIENKNGVEGPQKK